MSKIRLGRERTKQDVFSVAGFSNGQAVDHRGQQTRPVQLGRAYNFDLSNDNVVVPHNANFTFNGDFTVDVFASFSSFSSPAVQNIIEKRVNQTSSGVFIIYYFQPTDQFAVTFSNGSTNRTILVNNTKSINTPIHFAFVRSGDIHIFYIDGVEGGRLTETARYNNTANITLGGAGGGYFSGNIYNARIINGTALWTSNFTIPKTPKDYTNIPATLLLKCDEGGGTLAIDSSGNGNDGTLTNITPATFHTTLTNGQGADWQNQTGYTPNIRFIRANSHNITVAHNALFNVTDFNIECFVVPQQGADTGSIFTKANNASTDFMPFNLFYDGTSNRFRILASHNGSSFAVNLSSGNTFATDVRYHVCYSKSGNTYTLFVNGAVEAQTTVAGTLTTNASNILIGGNSASFFNGFISCISFHNRAIRTGAFTPYSDFEGYSAFVAANPPLFTLPNFQTLSNPFGFTFTNNAHSFFVPRNESNTTLDSFGDPIFYPDGRVKYNVDLINSACLTFDGIDSRVDVTDNGIVFGTSDFIIRAWIRPNSQTDGAVFSQNDATFAGSSVVVWLRADRLELWVTDGGAWTTLSGPLNAVTNNVWQLIECRRVGANIEILVSNVVVATLNIGAGFTLNNATSLFQIGARANTSSPYGGSIAGLFMSIGGTTIFNFPLSEGSGDRVFSRVGGHVGTLNNFAFPTAWATTQSVFHNNILNGFDSVGYYDATSVSHLLASPSTDLLIGTNDFTIDFWIYLNTALGSRSVLALCDNGVFTTGGFSVDGADFIVSNNGASVVIAHTAIPTLQWIHVEVSRNGSNLYIFKNGVIDVSTTNSTDINYTGGNSFVVGGRRTGASGVGSVGQSMTGFLANLRVFNGRALHTSGFNTNTLTETHYQNETANRAIFVRGLTDFNSPAKTVTNNSVGGVRKPIDTVTTTQPITQSNPAGTWHNGAETQWRNVQAPEIIQKDTSNFYFTGGSQNTIGFTQMGSPSGTDISISTTDANTKRRNAKIYTR